MKKIDFERFSSERQNKTLNNENSNQTTLNK